jgi:hypothetical protein
VNDPIKNPRHYTYGKQEVIDIIEGFNLPYHLGSVMKYILRAGHKEDEILDLKKARWYLDRYIQIKEESCPKSKKIPPQDRPRDGGNGACERAQLGSPQLQSES